MIKILSLCILFKFKIMNNIINELDKTFHKLLWFNYNERDLSHSALGDSRSKLNYFLLKFYPVNY